MYAKVDQGPTQANARIGLRQPLVALKAVNKAPGNPVAKEVSTRRRISWHSQVLASPSGPVYLQLPDAAEKRHAQGPVLPTAIAKGRGRRCTWAVMRRGQPNRAPDTVTTDRSSPFQGYLLFI